MHMFSMKASGAKQVVVYHQRNHLRVGISDYPNWAVSVMSSGLMADNDTIYDLGTEQPINGVEVELYLDDGDNTFDARYRHT